MSGLAPWQAHRNSFTVNWSGSRSITCCTIFLFAPLAVVIRTHPLLELLVARNKRSEKVVPPGPQIVLGLVPVVRAF